MSFIRKIKKGKNTYLALVENKWVKGKVLQRVIKYIGKEINGRAIASALNLEGLLGEKGR